METNPGALGPFHPLIREWFLEKYPAPTDIQGMAWPRIAAGEHLLVTAPTGSGKTLTAFLTALDHLIRGTWEGSGIRVLYVSPLKALNTDIHRNLLSPLAEIRTRFRERGEPFPSISVAVRSGDTPQSERQRMLRRPPDILITTPESLNLLLSARRSRELLGGIRQVILDEIHAVAGSKRGTWLMTAVERLAFLSGEFQRIGLSATVRPLQTVADFMGGFRLDEIPGEAGQPEPERTGYRKRAVSIVRSREEKRISLRVCVPDPAETGSVGEEAGESDLPDVRSPWPALAQEFRTIIRSNRASLFFTNNRRLAERLTLLVNEAEGREVAYSHHGSLSKELRRVVEERLKRGELAAIFATSSLELGIDIGTLDEVILVQTPPSVSSAIQRIGRAGHSVGAESRGRLYPTFGRDCLEAVALAGAVADRDIEEIRPPEGPLDVLAQVIVSMTGIREYRCDELYARIRTAWPYRDLPRRQFDLVLQMLAGRYAGTRIRELSPRVILDAADGTVRGRDGVLTYLYHSGGTIPDRGYFTLRHHGSGARIGELDEEFVWERKPGETFPLGAQSWKIVSIDHQNVDVVPWQGATDSVPFWRAEAMHRDFRFSERILRFLEEQDGRLEQPDWVRNVSERYGVDPGAAGRLQEFLLEQKETTRVPLPHRHHLVVERCRDSRGRADALQLFIHTLWGGRINHPFRLLLAAAWEEEYGYPLESYADDDALVLYLPNEASPDRLLERVIRRTAGRIEELLRKRLESTGFFGARFRENAGRALLLPRSGFGRRMPLWLNRLRAKKLLEAVRGFPDFPVLAETWRTCVRDDFDLPSLCMLLDEIGRGEILISETDTPHPSPFGKNLVWYATNFYMYQGDDPYADTASSLTDDLIREVAFSPHLRPRLAPALVDEFRRKLQRTWPGYAPSSAAELIDQVRERLFLPSEEWPELLLAYERDNGAMPGTDEAWQDSLVRFSFPGSREMLVAAAEELPRILFAFAPETARTAAAGLVSPVDFSSPAAAGQLPDIHRPDLLQPGTLRRLAFGFAAIGTARAGTSAADSAERAEETGSAASILAQWLRACGPVEIGRIAGLLGLEVRQAETLVAPLAEDGTLLIDRLSEGDGPAEACDAENLERLLRLARSHARPSFAPLPAARLQPFLAEWQGLIRRGGSEEALPRVLESLFGFPAPAALWESDILPARIEGYRPSWLDGLLRDSTLLWFGCSRRRISFALERELPLFQETRGSGRRDSGAAEGGPAPEPAEAESGRHSLLPAGGRYSFAEIRERNGLAAAELTERLWTQAFRGRISSDSFETVRRGIGVRFSPGKSPGGSGDPAGPDASAGPGTMPITSAFGRLRREGAARWRQDRTVPGNWFLLPAPPVTGDLLETEEEVKDRVRQLLARYGILSRRILEPELPILGWSRLFRTLRIMELSGEILGGYFFDGLGGIQFVSRPAFRMLRNPGEQEPVYWMNAADPASLCGRGIEELPARLPPRVPSTHLVFRGTELVLVSRRNGRDLEFRTGPEDPRIPEYLRLFHEMLERRYAAPGAIRITTVNGEPVRRSSFAPRLAEAGFQADYREYVLRGGYR